MEKIVNIIGLGLDSKTVIGFMIAGIVVIAFGIIVNTKAKVNMN